MWETLLILSPSRGIFILGLDKVAIVFLPLFIPSTFKDFSATEYTALPHLLMQTHTHTHTHIHSTWRDARKEQAFADETGKQAVLRGRWGSEMMECTAPFLKKISQGQDLVDEWELCSVLPSLPLPFSAPSPSTPNLHSTLQPGWHLPKRARPFLAFAYILGVPYIAPLLFSGQLLLIPQVLS